MAGMELINGVYYTPEDLARMREREAAAEARRQAVANEAAERIGTAHVEISDDRIRAILTELLEPVIEAIENLEGRVAAVEGSENAPETAENDSTQGNTPAGGVSAADEAGSSVSDAVSAEPVKRATRKVVK